MKKTIAFLLLLVMMTAALLSGCASSNGDGKASETTDGEALLEDVPATKSTALGSSYGISAALVTVKGAKCGEIHATAHNLHVGDPNAIVATAFSDGMHIPTDAETGYPIGAALYAPATFVHAADGTAVTLSRAAASSDTFEITVEFYRTNPANGLAEKYSTIKYENAKIVDLNNFSGEDGVCCQKVGFTFGKVTYTDLVNGTNEYTVTIR